MSNNKMDKLADALGVRMNRAFRLVGQGSTQYMITKYGLSKLEDGQELPADDNILYLLFRGVYEIEQEPGEPKRGSFFYTPDFDCKELFRPGIWSHEPQQLAAYRNGVVCRTPDEAIEMAKKMLEAVSDEK